MKTLPALLAGAALLALAACGGSADDPAETTVVETTETVPAPTVTETTIVEDGPDSGDDSVTISEDGVTADVDDGDTSVTADIDEDPSVTVRD